MGHGAIIGGAPDIGNDSRTNLQQALEVTSIQRQGIDRLVAHSAAQRGIGGIDCRYFPCDGDRLGLFPRLQHHINANGLPHL